LKKLPIVELGNSDKYSSRQWAIAIGNPLGLNNTVTKALSVQGVKVLILVFKISALTLSKLMPQLILVILDLAQRSRRSELANTAIIGGAQGLLCNSIETAQRVAINCSHPVE